MPAVYDGGEPVLLLERLWRQSHVEQTDGAGSQNTITLQGGYTFNEETEAETFLGALNGETLSKTPQKVPGGLLGLVKCNEISKTN